MFEKLGGQMERKLGAEMVYESFRGSYFIIQNLLRSRTVTLSPVPFWQW